MPRIFTVTDTELLRQAVAGEDGARDNFVLRYQSAIRHYLRTILLKEKMAPDAAGADAIATEVHNRLVARLYAEFDKGYERRPRKRFCRDLKQWLQEELHRVLYPRRGPVEDPAAWIGSMAKDAFAKAEERLKKVLTLRSSVPDMYYRAFRCAEAHDESSDALAARLTEEIGKGVAVTPACYRQWKCRAYDQFGIFLVEEVACRFPEIEDDEELFQRLEEGKLLPYVRKSKTCCERFGLREADHE